MSKTLIGFGLMMALVATVRADDKKGAPAKTGDKAPAGGMAGPPAPAPEFTSAAKYFVGNWKCDSSMPAGAWGPGGKGTSTLAFKFDMGDMWMNLDGDMKMADPKAPMHMTFRGLAGYDPTTKKIMRMDWNSSGATMHLSTAGWTGDKLVFEGDGMMMGQKMKLRHTITKKNDTEWTGTMETAGADGKWTPMGEDTCKKGAAKSK
jgi:hypothetical protein